jgi:uncharacterized protein (UPF0210 family)
MIRTDEILNTVDMIQKEKLDVRAVTMGISLLGVIVSDEEPVRRSGKDQTSYGTPGKTCEAVSAEYSIPW